MRREILDPRKAHGATRHAEAVGEPEECNKPKRPVRKDAWKLCSVASGYPNTGCQLLGQSGGDASDEALGAALPRTGEY